jgi:GT2 family glycosyltransferase
MIEIDKTTATHTYFAHSPVKDLSIIVVSYNTRELLRKCLQSVYSYTHQRYDFEVLVIDNASSDGSVEMVRADFPQVTVLENHENRGFAAANNQGLRQSQGNYIMLLNPDAEVIGPAIWQMLAFLEAETQAAVVGPALQYPNGDFQEGAFYFPSLSQLFFEFFPLNWRLTRSRLNGRYPRRFYGGDYPRAFEIDFPLGACFMLRRTVIEQVGLLDEDFFMYMEEIDWCYRIRQAQMVRGYEEVSLRWRAGRRQPHYWKIYCLPAAKVIHHGSASASQFREAMFYQLYKSRNYFYKKHYSYFFQITARWLTRFGLAWVLMGAVVQRLRKRVQAETLQAQWRTYRRIWRLQ